MSIAKAIAGIAVFLVIPACLRPAAADPAAESERSSQQNLRIGKITIIHQSIFTGQESGPTEVIYSLAERFHVNTRMSFIRKELLFREGDPFNQEDIEETQRNLRRYKFVDSVEIRRKTRSDGKVDITVKLRDQWSTLPLVYFRGGGGRSMALLGFREFNFLGTGKEFNLALGKSFHSKLVQSRYCDPHFLDTMHRLDLRFTARPDGDDVSVDFKLPFYSTSRPLAYGVYFRRYRYRTPMLPGRNTSYNSRHNLNIGRMFVGKARKRGRARNHLTFSYDLYANAFRPRPGYNLPAGFPEEDIVRSKFNLTWGGNYYRWVREKYLNKMGRVEDLLLGFHYYLSFGRSLAALGAYRNENFISAAYKTGVRLGGKSYLLSDGNLVTRNRKGNWEQTIFTNSIRFYSKVLPHQVIAARLYNRIGRNLDPWSKFYLGGTDGLRGYRAWWFRGKKMAFLFNLENRLFVGREFASISPGVVAFYDCGTVWDNGDTIRLKDLHSDIGIGLRLGLNRAPGAMVLRIDLARPLEPGGRPYISFGQEQAF